MKREGSLPFPPFSTSLISPPSMCMCGCMLGDKPRGLYMLGKFCMTEP